MTFNCGHVAAVKASSTIGGVFSISHIDGGARRAPAREVPEIGSTIGTGELEVFKPWSQDRPAHYPLDCKFDSDGIAVIDFLYDHGVTPHTVSGPGGILATNFRYRVKLGSSGNTGSGQLLHFTNVGATSRIAPHFVTPSVPIDRIQGAVDKLVAQARRLAAVINSMSRPCLAGIVVVD